MAADPNMRMPRSIFPNEIINIILLENQIINGFGKTETDSEDSIREYRAEIEAYSWFKAIPEAMVSS